MKKQKKFGLVLAAAAVISVSVASLVGARGWVQQGADWYYLDGNNDPVTETIQSSGSAKFYLGENGAMVRDYFLEDDGNGNTYYFGSNGAMVTNTWVAIDSSVVDATGDYVPDNYWYYFQSSGKAMKGNTSGLKKATIDGKKYAFNLNGQMAVGWVDENGDTISPDNSNPFDGALYYCGGDNDGALRSGWVTYYDGYSDADGGKADYTNLYFYFNPSNNQLVKDDTKKINGRTYAFDELGVMLSGWDVYEEGRLLTNKTTYFSGEDDGHQVKSGWVYAVPSAKIDEDLNNDNEEKYMYFSSDGNMKTSEIAKINGKYYVFDTKGVMKTGIVIWRTTPTTGSKFVNTIDTDYAKGADVAKKGILQTGSADSTDFVRVDYAGHTIGQTGGDFNVKLHYFGDDGARKTGLNSVEFADDPYVMSTTNGGDRGSTIYKKKYYSLGVALKANSDIKYGLYTLSTWSQLKQQANNWTGNAETNQPRPGEYHVLTTSGSKQGKSNTSKKDGNDNYWLIDANGFLEGIYTVNIKYGKNSVKTGFTLRTSYEHGTTMDSVAAAFAVFDASPSEVKDNTAYTVKGVTGAKVRELKPGEFNGTTADGTWTAKVAADHKTVTFALEAGYTGKAYQSDINDKTNQWIPYDVKDAYGYSGKDYRLATEKLNDDYFLNCYWDNDTRLGTNNGAVAP